MSEQAPKWMNELEDRIRRIYNQRRQLGHEVGAGSPCLTCKAACPGLDLHYWRKICLHCKCPKEDHDVPVEDRSKVLDTLLGQKAQNNRVLELKLKAKSRNEILDQSDQGDLSVKKMVFTWIPPNVSSDMASEYMEQLPSAKIPVCGSHGAQYRRIQLDKQIPLHDITPISNFMTTPEKSSHLDYLRDLREAAVGQGKIQRICLKQFREESVACTNLPEPVFSKQLKPESARREETLATDFERTLSNTINNLQNLMMSPYRSFGPGNEKPSPNTALKMLPGSIPTNVLRVPSAFLPKNESPKTSNESYGAFLADVPDPNDDDEEDLNMSGVCELPPESEEQVALNAEGPPLQLVRKEDPTLQLMKKEKEDSDSQPTGATQISNPKTRSSASKSLNFGIDEVKNDKVQLRDRDKNANKKDESNVMTIEKKMDCHECKLPVNFGSVAVVADRAGRDTAWHPQCFVCKICKELLVDLIYFFHKGDVFCGRHYAEKKNVPRCKACDELIFLNQYTLADNKPYHVFHFICFECNSELANKQYLVIKGVTVCVNCYENKYAEKCQSCKKLIKPNEIGMRFRLEEEIHWHELCFKCHFCAKPLINCKFLLNNKDPFCSKECTYRSTQ